MGHYRNNLRHHRTNLRHNTSQYPRHQSALANPDPTYARRHRSNSPDRCNRCSLCSHKTENDQTCRQVASDHLEESHCAKKAIYSVRFMCSRSPAPVCSSPYDGEEHTRYVQARSCHQPSGENLTLFGKRYI